MIATHSIKHDGVWYKVGDEVPESNSNSVPSDVKKGDGKLNKKKRQASFKKLDTLIKARNVSFYKLSEELGMARSTFSDWKSGKSMPKTDKLIKIANYFGVEVSYFIE